MFENKDTETWTNPPIVGEIRTVMGTTTETRAIAVRWDNPDNLVTMNKVTEMGRTSYNVFDSTQTDASPANIATFAYGEEEEKMEDSLQTFLSRAFGM